MPAERRLEELPVLLRKALPVRHDHEIGTVLAAAGDHFPDLRDQLLDLPVPAAVRAHEEDLAIRPRRDVRRRELHGRPGGNRERTPDIGFAALQPQGVADLVRRRVPAEIAEEERKLPAADPDGVDGNLPPQRGGQLDHVAGRRVEAVVGRIADLYGRLAGGELDLRGGHERHRALSRGDGDGVLAAIARVEHLVARTEKRLQPRRVVLAARHGHALRDAVAPAQHPPRRLGADVLRAVRAGRGRRHQTDDCQTLLHFTFLSQDPGTRVAFYQIA